MDFGALPPEVNSARMYTGPGAAPMMAAAGAWNDLAAELSSMASFYQAVISELAGDEWLGPASASMAAAAAPYVAWMNSTAAAAEHAAAQAMASAAAFETAFAMTVPPAVVAANRAQLAALVATNILGQNTPAIMATEAQYLQMWAQDAAAMYGYAASSANAATLYPLTSPAPTTNPAGVSGQVAAVAHAAASSAGTQSGLSQLVATLPNTVQGLASPLPAASGSSASGLSGLMGTNGFLSEIINSTENIGIWNGTQTVTGMAGNIGAWNMFAGISSGVGLAKAGPAAFSGVQLVGADGVVSSGVGEAALASPAGGAVAGGAPVFVNVGQAPSVGGLSVPASWSAATPAGTASATLSGTGWTVDAEQSPPVATMPAGMPSVASAGRGSLGFGAPRYGVKPTVMPRPVVAG
ncbi:PPE family protein [Mycobacterium botniense]|uniref:PPE family protein PPE15 n=1 Tax=Mycobacterium botniense TaxID=84962 RepID=A0A7I9Y3A1_9MYCO|nr:PPE family protein [Mycobacterium botniense]GFG76363.1 PPE family protein PPE15 [Mycobacterium botniense]